MLKRLSLRVRILVLLGALIGVNCAGALVTLWYTKRTQALYASMVDRDVEALLAAQKLESSLVMPKGFVTYYFLNRDPQWLTPLSDYHGRFEDWLRRARQSAYLEEAREILNAIAFRSTLAYKRPSKPGFWKRASATARRPSW